MGSYRGLLEEISDSTFDMRIPINKYYILVFLYHSDIRSKKCCNTHTPFDIPKNFKTGAYLQPYVEALNRKCAVFQVELVTPLKPDCISLLLNRDTIFWQTSVIDDSEEPIIMPSGCSLVEITPALNALNNEIRYMSKDDNLDTLIGTPGLVKYMCGNCCDRLLTSINVEILKESPHFISDETRPGNQVSVEELKSSSFVKLCSTIRVNPYLDNPTKSARNVAKSDA